LKEVYAAADLNMRATCFPYLSEQVDNHIPTDLFGKPMV
jgi:hypothetical protein